MESIFIETDTGFFPGIPWIPDPSEEVGSYPSVEQFPELPVENPLKLDRLKPLLGEAISLVVPSACTCFVRGPSGSGKSLLLRAVADLDLNEGEVWLGELRRSEMAAHRWRRRVGLLPAESHWWEDRVGTHHRAWSEAILGALGFETDVLDWSVSRLSTGEKQRLALARLLANRPAALLLDEPVANLDAANAERVVKVIDNYQKAHGAPLLWVSHGSENAAAACRGTLWLDEGKVVKRELQWN